MEGRVAKIRNEAIADARTQTAALALLFPKNGRPDRAAICAAIDKVPRTSVSFDPGLGDGKTGASWAEGMAGGTVAEANSWLELLVDGLTFDLVGLAPGPAINAPEIEFRIDCDPDLELGDFDLVGLAPGPHLAGGANSLFVAKVLVGLGCELATQIAGVRGFYWFPSRSITGSGFFRSTVTAWLEGGPFPALGLSAFRSCGDGSIESVGLAFFTGQEVRIQSQLAADATIATRLGIRLVHQLASHGPLNETESIVGPDGAGLQLEPIENGQIVLVRAA